jgi:hypothetical protein
MLALADNATARMRYGADMAPSLRVCFSLGSHYSYYQVEGLNPRGYDYIVGEVTISLARMIDRCLPGQILIGEFDRPVPRSTKVLNTAGFVQQASELLERFKGMRVSGGNIRQCACYLTGEEVGSGFFNILRFEILDKHGFSHHAYNQKMNVILAPREKGGDEINIFLGKQQEELIDFAAKAANASSET